MMHGIELIVTGAIAMMAGAVPPQIDSRPEAFLKLVQCRQISAPEARLACFDKEAAAVETAEAQKELVVFDRKQIKQTRQSLFGLQLPHLTLPGSSAEDNTHHSVESTIKSVWRIGHDKWGFELEDGARWLQTDSRNLGIDPLPGQPIKIRRAAMGSYMANVNKQIAIRVRRVK